MWFLLGGLAVVVLIMGFALVGDLRRRRQRRLETAADAGRDRDAAFRRGRAGIDVSGAGARKLDHHPQSVQPGPGL